MRLRFLALLLLAMLAAGGLLSLRRARAAQTLAPAEGVVFVLDAGHGGEDGGAVSADGLLESQVNLAVTQRLELLLSLCGADTRMTRSGEQIDYPPEADTTRKRKRADQAQRLALVDETEGAVLVSIHQNTFPAASAHGAQVFYGTVEPSRDFAVCAQAYLAVLGKTGRSAAAIPDSIYLMREAKCPAILVECGFLSNRQELALLETEEYRTKLALCLTAACLDYTEELELQHGKG